MSTLELKLDDADFPDDVYGKYSDRQALPILQQYLNARISDYQAAAQLLKLLPAASERNSQSRGLSQFGDFLCRMSEQIPYSHPAQSRLAQLVHSLDSSVKMTEKAEEDGYSFWALVDGFNICLRENFPSSFVKDDPEFPNSYSDGLNFSAFCARLLQCGFLGRSSFPIWEMRRSLESKITHEKSFRFAISSSSLWFIIAGQTIYTQVVQAPNYRSPKGHGPGELYKGPETGLERWTFWKNALADAGGDKEATSEHCTLARKAAAVMEAIEQSMTF